MRGESRGRFTFYHLNTDAVRAAAARLNALADTADASALIYRECP